MHNTIRSADQGTHIKIVAISLVAAIAVVVIGFNARNVGINGEAPVVTKVGKPLNFSTKDIPTVR